MSHSFLTGLEDRFTPVIASPNSSLIKDLNLSCPLLLAVLLFEWPFYTAGLGPQTETERDPIRDVKSDTLVGVSSTLIGVV